MKGEDIRVRWLDESPVHPVDQCMRRFMVHDVMGEARKHRPTRELGADLDRLGREVAEQQSALRGTVERVRLPECVWVDPELFHESDAIRRLRAACPEDAPA